MVPTRRNGARSLFWAQQSAPTAGAARQPGAAAARAPRPQQRAPGRAPVGAHPLSDQAENARLFEYERGVKARFDAIVPVLKRIAALQHEEDFEALAQPLARAELGFELPAEVLGSAWVERLDMRRLFAWCMFEAYRRFCDDFFANEPLRSADEAEFEAFLKECGFHTLDISPCADGRLAHVIRYVLRLPYRAVRRKSYAGALFDIDDSLEKWVETELGRFREGRPNTADEATRYLKAVVYHYSSTQPAQEGCAAHGSDGVRAAQAGVERLYAFQEAVQNSFCCGASIDLLLIGLDTDADAIRVHVPDAEGRLDLERCVDAGALHEATVGLQAAQAEARVAEAVREAGPDVPAGMAALITRLVVNNFSQLDYVRQYVGEHYPDIGHAERIIAAGIGFEEVQLRNLTYFAYLHTVEEGAPDLDVGVKIFSRLNVGRGLPVPVVVRYDYHGEVPGARERAVERCNRVAQAMRERYEDLVDSGLFHTMLVVRDCSAGARIEVLGCSAGACAQAGTH